MLIASVIGRVQGFLAMFDPVSTQSLGRDQCQKPMMLFAGNSGGQCPPYILMEIPFDWRIAQAYAKECVDICPVDVYEIQGTTSVPAR